MTTLLPNLSGLKLSSGDDQEAPETVETGIPYRQLKMEPPEDYVRFEHQYKEALFSDNKITAIADAIEKHNRVLWSTNNEHIYASMPEQDHFAVGTKRWWWEWCKMLEEDKNLNLIGKGSWNVVYGVPEAQVKRTLPEECFQLIFDQKTAPKSLVIRKNKQSSDPKDKVIREMITASYAHFYGFGPVIFAQFYIKNNNELDVLKRQNIRRLPWDTVLQEQEYKGPRGTTLSTIPLHVYTISEAWEGNCRAKISSHRSGRGSAREQQFEPSKFAAEFVSLCMRAANAGFWHMDIKRENLLYRTSECRPLELSFTDFDDYFCRILSPSERSKTYKCCIAATAACFLGEIRCYEGIDKWREYAPEVKKAMKTFAGIDLDNMQPTDWCFFLRATSVYFGENEVKVLGSNTIVREELERVGDRFRNHLNNYITEDPNRNRAAPDCFRFERGIPLFHQIVNFAFKDFP